jgi:hypothetical protein
LDQALDVSAKDVKDASAGVLRDLKRFQGQKEEDLRRYMVSLTLFHLSRLDLTGLHSAPINSMPNVSWLICTLSL